MNTATNKAKATNLYTNNKIPDLPQLNQSKATYILFLLVLLQCRTEGDGLVNGQMPAGQHTVQVDASGLSSGVYLYQLRTPVFTQTRKMLLMK